MQMIKMLMLNEFSMNNQNNQSLIFTEHEDGRRGGEIARTVLWNSELSFCITIRVNVSFLLSSFYMFNKKTIFELLYTQTHMHTIYNCNENFAHVNLNKFRTSSA